MRIRNSDASHQHKGVGFATRSELRGFLSTADAFAGAGAYRQVVQFHSARQQAAAIRAAGTVACYVHRYHQLKQRKVQAGVVVDLYEIPA